MSNSLFAAELQSLKSAESDMETSAPIYAVRAERSALELLDDVHSMVRDVLSQWQHPTDALERRDVPRIAFQKSLALFEVDQSSETPIGEPQLVIGKDISMYGVGFRHDGPLPFTKVAIGFELPDGCSQFILVRLTWCRFTRRGHYESGGTFLRPIDAPDGVSLEWNSMTRL